MLCKTEILDIVYKIEMNEEELDTIIKCVGSKEPESEKERFLLVELYKELTLLRSYKC